MRFASGGQWRDYYWGDWLQQHLFRGFQHYLVTDVESGMKECIRTGFTRVDHGALHWSSLTQSDGRHHKCSSRSRGRCWHHALSLWVLVMRCICVVIETDGYELCKPLALRSMQHSRIQYLGWWMLNSGLLSAQIENALEMRVRWWLDIPYAWMLWHFMLQWWYIHSKILQNISWDLAKKNSNSSVHICWWYRF